VDTSVWIDFFRRGGQAWKADLLDLLSSDRAAVVSPVVAELLYGSKGDKGESVVMDLAQSVTVLPTGLDRWIEAGVLGRALRSEGLTLSIIDCLVASVARESDLMLWTLDADFDPLFVENLLRRYQPVLTK